MKLRLREPPLYVEGGTNFEPGDCWYARPVLEGANTGRWAKWADHDEWVLGMWDIARAHKDVRPMIVVLPNGVPHVLQAPTIRRAAKPADAGDDMEWAPIERGPGWTVEGELPDVTVRPSIDYDPGGPRAWHGTIQDGEMQ